MAATFKKGDVLRLKALIPQGSVEKVQMNADGEIQYLITWADPDGDSNQRWFGEGEVELMAAPTVLTT